MVLLSGILCGGTFGSVSQIIYIISGIMGIPWFAKGSSGLFTLLSPTGGYLIGFIIAPFIIGKYTDNITNRKFLSQVKLMMLGVSIIYLFGAISLSFTIKSRLWKTLIKGVFPFILIDLIKAILAAGISFSILPKLPYNDKLNNH